MSVLQKLLEEKNWNISDLAREYGKRESPELSPDEAIKKYGSLMRKTVNDPDHTKHGTVKRLIEILGGELVVRVKRVEELSL
jgi:ribosomal protein S19E (S16A)